MMMAVRRFGCRPMDCETGHLADLVGPGAGGIDDDRALRRPAPAVVVTRQAPFTRSIAVTRLVGDRACRRGLSAVSGSPGGWRLASMSMTCGSSTARATASRRSSGASSQALSGEISINGVSGVADGHLLVDLGFRSGGHEGHGLARRHQRLLGKARRRVAIEFGAGGDDGAHDRRGRNWGCRVPPTGRSCDSRGALPSPAGSSCRKGPARSPPRRRNAGADHQEIASFGHRPQLQIYRPKILAPKPFGPLAQPMETPAQTDGRDDQRGDQRSDRAPAPRHRAGSQSI